MKSDNAPVTLSLAAKRFPTFSICLAALLLLGQLSAQKQVKESKELQHYKESAMKGWVELQFRLGELYDPETIHGPTSEDKHQQKGTPLTFAVTKSYPEAVKWYQMAANGGNGAAKTRLDDIYRQGKLGAVGPSPPPVATSTRRETAPVNRAEVKQFQKMATDAKYFTSALFAARKWVDNLELNGTPAEKALAHKWLDVHTGAKAAGDLCQGCETPHSDSERRLAIGAFYEEQGGEFKAFAKRWQNLGRFSNEEETGEHIPTTAEILAGVAADATGVIAQGRAQRAAIERGQIPGETLPHQTANGQANANSVNSDVDSAANRWRATGLQFSPATITRYADSAAAGDFVNMSVTISSPIGGTAGWLLECGEASNNGLGPAFGGVQTRQGNAWGNFTPSGTRISVDFSPGNSAGDHVCRIRVSPKRAGEQCCSGQASAASVELLNSTFHVMVRTIQKSGGVR